MNLIYLAAGMGKRLKNITFNQPKCLAKINDKRIIDYNIPNFSLFNKVIVISGYKSLVLKEYLKKNKKITFIKNSKYKTTNMVKSISLAKKYVDKSDIIICYGDIIFDQLIINKLIKNKK